MKIDKEQILDALGIESGRGRWLGIALTGFGVGCLAGAVLAMLVAPKSGAELRSDLVARGRDIARRGREAREAIEHDEDVLEKNPTPRY